MEMRGTLDAGHPTGGGIRLCSFMLPRGLTGEVRLSVELEIRPGVLKPVAWSCEQALNPDGSITVQVQPADASGWRKGV